MKITLSNLLSLTILFAFSFTSMPVSKEAKLIEQVSSSEWLIEATGKYLSAEKKDRKKRSDVEKKWCFSSHR